jgi:hypothetical protein
MQIHPRETILQLIAVNNRWRGTIGNGVASSGVLRLVQLNSMLQFHERVLAELDRRETAVEEQETEARRLLEEALARCASERALIAQERTVLEQAEQVYRRFLQTNVVAQTTAAPEPPRELEAEVEQPARELELVGSAAEANVMPDAVPVPEWAPERALDRAPEPLAPSDPEPVSDFESRIRELRSDLCNQIIAEDKVEHKGPKWTGSLRGLLGAAS